jgi:hypothetical protein
MFDSASGKIVHHAFRRLLTAGGADAIRWLVELGLKARGKT